MIFRFGKFCAKEKKKFRGRNPQKGEDCPDSGLSVAIQGDLLIALSER
jgi:nucleoid DNA-binding protein